MNDSESSCDDVTDDITDDVTDEPMEDNNNSEVYTLESHWIGGNQKRKY